MFGFDISWAAFNCVEAMSASHFRQKRVGYLVASQAIKQGADVVLLTTNLFKKVPSSPPLIVSIDICTLFSSFCPDSPLVVRQDLVSNDSPFESAVAMNCLSNICTPELARDLASDVVALMNNSR